MESGAFEGFWHRFEQSQLSAPALKRCSYGSDTSITSRRREKQTRNSFFPHSADERTDCHKHFFLLPSLADRHRWDITVSRKQVFIVQMMSVCVLVQTDKQGCFPQQFHVYAETTCLSTPLRVLLHHHLLYSVYSVPSLQ